MMIRIITLGRIELEERIAPCFFFMLRYGMMNRLGQRVKETRGEGFEYLSGLDESIK